MEEYDGVTGHMVFDPNLKNVAQMYLGTVHDGAISYRAASINKRAVAEQPAAPAAAALPYAQVGEDGVGYAVPRAVDHSPGPVRVILFGPAAAQVAESPQMATALHTASEHGRNWTLVPIDSSQNWGAASTQLVHALMDEHALAILALDRDAAHLAEQLALKSFVPVVAISSDKSLTSADIPWIFRLQDGTAPAFALRLLADAADRNGVNSKQIRDALASGRVIAGVAFQSTGELRTR
jgi:hypothetical protein